MACRTTILCLLAATLSAVCSQPVAPPRAAQAAAQKPAGDGPKGDRLGKPVPVKVDGKPLQPWGSPGLCVGDFDGDGRPDLLLGHENKGRLAIYRNVGTKTEPRLTGPQFFDDLVPTGRIPKG